jgi:hypothetical protein
MADDPHAHAPPDADRLARLEARLARLEAHLGIARADDSTAAVAAVSGQFSAAPPVVVADGGVARTEDELEFEVGQNWFAVAGIVALTLGAGFLLSLPFASLPAIVPSLAGYLVVGALFFVARMWRDTFAAVAGYLRGAGMAFLLFSTLRLSFPLSRPVLAIDSLAAHLLLLAVVAANLWLALRRKSPWLMGVALATGGVMVAVVNAHWLAFGGLGLLAIVAVYACVRERWRVLELASVAFVYAAYLAWALGPQFRGVAWHFATAPAVAPVMLLSCAIVLASGWWWRAPAEGEGNWEAVHALLNCALGYGLFLVHTAIAFPAAVATDHALAFAVFLGIAIVFWQRRASRASTFFYAMTGYAALSVAILKASSVPAVFVWLSVQSVVVVATAIWFRSRFIVVANFLIYVGIVLGYIVVAERETGISLGFGVVALVSARILNWQQDRLELKTTLMRNAYLVGAWLVFPYALYHLVPGKYVALAWVGLALGYYALNLLVQNQKYRWMGHATLLLTMCYVIVVGTSRFEPVYRVLSFLVLGTVLLVVSLVFTRLRKRRAVADATEHSTLNV